MKYDKEIQSELIETQIYSPIGKHYCTKCITHMAVWMYAPSSDRWEEADRYYCDDCVPRGCSCNIIDDWGNPDGAQYADELGRKLPCVEFWYDDTGFEKK